MIPLKIIIYVAELECGVFLKNNGKTDVLISGIITNTHRFPGIAVKDMCSFKLT